VKSVVFSQWTTMLDKIEPHLKQAHIPFVRLDGKMPRKKREACTSPCIDRTRICSFVVAYSGALGLNLTVASQVFIMDPWWNATLQDQAIDRVYRLGQTKPVNVIQLVMQGSIEEKVISIQLKK
ncbi:P-loop containing nucleoside triphosphate hydrolase protein, partial [Syncephalis pseudoplumigaleata]